jgi:threonine aldolase
MANQIALAVLGRPGAAAVCGARSHVYRHELGGAAANSGVQLTPVPDAEGRLDPDEVRGAFVDGPARVELVCLEDTHGGAGGRAVAPAEIGEVAAVAHEHGARVHLDGARIFNACVALDCEPVAFTAHADTMMFCVSKGLGAPVGSLFCGPADLVERARTVRRRLGGGMRQSGVLAAAGIVALETRVAGLAHDHVRARRLAEGIAELFPDSLDPTTVDTNMVFARVDRLPEKVVPELAARGVLCGMGDREHVRFVLHHQVDDDGVTRAIDALRSLA